MPVEISIQYLIIKSIYSNHFIKRGDILFTPSGALSSTNAKRSEVYLLRGKNPTKAFEDNIFATFNLIDLAKKYKVRKVLVASSMGVDNFKINPSIYGMTKYFCEQLSHTYKKTKNMNIAICKI